MCPERFRLLAALCRAKPFSEAQEQVRQALHAHIAGCPACLAFLRAFPADGPAYPVREPEPEPAPYP